MYEDINLKDRTIRIQRQLIPTKAGLIFEQPKSEDSNRIIHATHEVISMIQDHIQRQEKYKEMVGGEYQVFSEITNPSSPELKNYHFSLTISLLEHD